MGLSGFNIFGGTFLVLAAILSCPSSALSENVEKTMAALDATYERLKGLEARFTQTTKFVDFDTQAISTGRIYLKKGKLRWDYVTPHQQQILVDGDTLLQYVPEHDQVIKSPIGRRTGLPIDLLTNLGALRKQFQIAEQDKGVFTWTPKDKKSPLPKMDITLLPAPKGSGVLIHKVVLYEDNGNQSTFVFTDFQIDKKWRDNPFILKWPEGVEVIEMP